MSPPKLPADAPVLDVIHPVAVGVFVFLRIEANGIVFHRLGSRSGQLFHLQKPLHGELRLNGFVGPLRESYLVGVGLRFIHQSGGLQILFNLGAYGKTIHAGIHCPMFIQRAVGIKDIDGGEVIFLSQHIVVHVVCRGYLQAAGTEFDVHILIFDYRYHSVDQGHDYFFPFQMGILRIVRVDAHRRIAHDGFGSRGSHHSIGTCWIAFNLITEIVKLSMYLLVDHLLIRQCRKCLRVPVDHPHTPVYQSFFIQIAKHFQHTLRTDLVHGEGRSVPVACCTQLLQLLQNDAAVLVCPVPCILQKLLA